MNLFCVKLLDSFKLKKAVKVISGLNNFNITKIYQMLKSAEISKATYIDLTANTKVVSFLKKITEFPLCVSSIDPLELYNCYLVGADIVEIGNFDIFYRKQINFSEFDILKLAIETRKLVKNRDICVTIPHTLNLYEQIHLAKKLEKLGINFLQTEGLTINFCNSYINLLENYRYDIVSRSIYFAASTLSATYMLSSFVNIPIIASSKINYISSTIAISCGASGIGVKSAIYSKNTIHKMSVYISEMLYMINLFTKLHCKLQPVLKLNKTYILNKSYKNIK